MSDDKKAKANAFAEEFMTQINSQRRLLERSFDLLSAMNDNPAALELAGMIRAQLQDHVELHDAVAALVGDDDT